MINFLKYRYIYLTISLAVLIPGIFSLIVWGLSPSIDFVGGTIIEIRGSSIDQSKLKEVLANHSIDTESIRTDGNTITIRSKPIDRTQWDDAKKELSKQTDDKIPELSALEDTVGEESPSVTPTEATPNTELENQATESAQLSGTETKDLEELRFETVGPVLGAELLQKTVMAVIIAIIVILLYIAWAFKNIKYGVSAIAALFHDVLVVIGIFSLLGHFYGVEVDVLFVTAVLTTMSFSVHDTIVVFDRIRESLRRDSLPFDVTVNKALTETMSRSVNNSMTIVFMLLALVLLGGETIKWFAVALLIGTMSGTYSSPFVAAPLLYILLKKKFNS